MIADVSRRPDPAGGLAAARRLVVKIGSALLVDEPDGAIRRAWLDALADDVAALLRRGAEVMLVSSGAIAVGRRHLDLRRPVRRIILRQCRIGHDLDLGLETQDRRVGNGLAAIHVIETRGGAGQERQLPGRAHQR